MIDTSEERVEAAIQVIAASIANTARLNCINVDDLEYMLEKELDAHVDEISLLANRMAGIE